MATHNLISFLLVGALSGSTWATDFCPNVKVIEKLDMAKLEGEWWAWDFNGMISYTEPHRCHVSRFYKMPGGKTIKVINDYVYHTDKPNHLRYSWNIEDESPTADGHLTVTMKLRGVGEKKIQFEILDTDYDRYLVILMCHDSPLFLGKMRSALTLLRSTNMKQEDLDDVSKKVEAALAKSNMKREDLGLFHEPTYTKDCESVSFPKAVSDGKITVIDTQAFTATVNGVAAHASHAVEDADSLVKDAGNPKIDRQDLAKRMKEHADYVKAIAKDIKDLSSL